jgi:carboxypeptidase Taq
VEADECTYNLHIILRYEIEVDLLEGRIGAGAVPEVWNAKIKQYLGIDVPDDARGCLQDVHWSHGALGYFPTYALGNLYAAQLFEAALRDMPDLWERVGAGEFLPLRQWLREHIHRHGRRKMARQFLRDISGAEPHAEPYLKYLEEKFGAIYGI